MLKTFKRIAIAALVLAPLATSFAAGPDVGRLAPDFSLTDINGKAHKLSDYKGKYVILEWTNYSCPFVHKHYGSGNMQGLQAWAKDKGYVWLSICSSANGKEGYMSYDEWKKAAADAKAVPTEILVDSSGATGKMYDAKTTPDMYVIDPKGTLIYKGAIDDKPTFKQEDVKTAKNYVKQAIEESAGGKPVTTASTDSYGCSIKYANKY